MDSDSMAAALGPAVPADGAGDPVESVRIFAEIESVLFGTTRETMSLARYRVGERIGFGGMGVVHRAWDPELARDVAIKLIPATTHAAGEAQRSHARALLLREAQALARLAHPNIVAVHDVGTYDLAPGKGGVFVVMELIEGPTLREWTKAERRRPAAVLDRFVEAARGLAAAHRAGLVHRDFKPHNAMVGADGRVRVLDFGLARGRADSRIDETEPSHPPRAPALDLPLTHPGIVAGTPTYMSPEQHRGEALDAASDQYSFCVALFEALYGQLPFAGRTGTELADAKHGARLRPPPPDARVSAGLRRVLARGLALVPRDRFPDMDALVAALEVERSPRRSRWRRLGGPALVVVALAGLALAGPLAGNSGDREGPRPPLQHARVELVAAEAPLVATDRATPLAATLVHDDGAEPLGFVRDAAADPSAVVVALLGLDGALRIDHGDRVDLVAHDVVPGLAVCPAGKLVYAQEFGRYAEPRPELRAFVHEAGLSRPIDIDPRALDRIVALAPDCERVIVVVRSAGWPVVAVARLDGTRTTLGLTNVGLADARGTAPVEFVPPPVDASTLAWQGEDTLQYEVDGTTFTLELGAGRALPETKVARPAWSPPITLDRYRRPVGEGFTITRYFDLGGARDWACGEATFPGHRGTDFAPTSPDVDTTVFAAAEALVVATHDGEHDGCESGNCRTGAGFGNHVILRHPDGKYTVYAHLQRFSVRVRAGDIVQCGAAIAAAGSSGPATGVHLHFEVRNDAGHHTIDDPFGGPCGGPVTYWVAQHPRGVLPGMACEPLGE
jgi:murein DD-endopeptidase MepM/ murein hydrolase activator NlpD/predicted Ser/Thr protein kinase